MANRRDFFFKQRVTEQELDDSNLQLELSDFDIKKDAFAGPNGFLMAAVTVVQEGGGTLRIDLGTALGWDKDGQRVENPNAQTFEDLSTFQDATLQVDANIYVQFDRALSDSRTDGLGNIVNFVRDETFQITVDAGAPGAGPPALDPTKGIFLAEVAILAAPGVIVNANINTSGQNLRSSFPSSRLANAVGFPEGYLGEIKIVRGATPASQIEVEFCRALDRTGVKVLSLTNQTIDATSIGVDGVDVGPAHPSLSFSTFYFVYAIGDTTLALPDAALISLSAGPGFGDPIPTLPAGYDVFRFIGAVPTDAAGNFISLRQINGMSLYENSTLVDLLVFSGDPGAAFAPPFTTSAGVPKTAERVLVSVEFLAGGASAQSIEFRSGAIDPVTGFTHSVEFGQGPSAAQHSEQFWLEVAAPPTLNIEARRVIGPALSGVSECVISGFVTDLKHA